MIRNGRFPRPLNSLRKESFGGALIAARLNQDVDHIAVLIHGSPKIVSSTIDSNENFVQVPAIAEPALTPL